MYMYIAFKKTYVTRRMIYDHMHTLGRPKNRKLEIVPS